MTKAERSQINRDNAKKSTGPKTEAGKAVSRQNATTHGMRAKALPLPDEDPKEIQAKHNAWNDHYNPQTPADQELVNQAVHASIQFDRCVKFQHAVVSKQVRDAQYKHETELFEELERLKTLLKVDPTRAVRELQRFAIGCQWLTLQWQRLRAKLVAEGSWCDSDRAQACRLTGVDPDLMRLASDESLYIIVLYNFVAAKGDRDDPLWKLLCSPEFIPDTLVRSLARGLPTEAAARAYLLEHVDRTLADLAEREGDLQPLAEADYQEAGDRALLIEDAPMARLVLRYQSEARTTFHRAYSALEKAKKAADQALENAVSPNEPNEAIPPQSTASPATTCGEPVATVSEKESGVSVGEPIAKPVERPLTGLRPVAEVANDRPTHPVGPVQTATTARVA